MIGEFRYRRGELHCEGVKVKEIGESVGTPVYIYSYKAIVKKYAELNKAFASLSPLICFSVKANSNLSICRVLTKEGAGLEIVSGGELYRAKRIRAHPKKIIFTGVGKREEEIREAVEYGVLLIYAESEQELELLEKVAKEKRKRIKVGLRINPDVLAGGHKYIQTGKKESKFGLPLKRVKKIFMQRKQSPYIELCALHFHLGSYITTPQPFVDTLKRVIPLVKELEEMGIGIGYLDIGGGFYQPAEEFAKAIIPLLKGFSARLILEPGRFLIVESGMLLSKVLYTKTQGKKRFIVVDAGMNDFIRPALYNASHQILSLHKSRGEHSKVNIVGPVCESGDFFAQGIEFPLIERGEYLAIMNTGAYGFTMSSNYNSRPRPAEVLVKEDRFYLIREREGYKDLVRGEKIWS